MPNIKRRGYRIVTVKLPNKDLKLYRSARIADAFESITEDMTLYKGVKFGQVLEAVYTQGKKDGAREAFKHLDRYLLEAKKKVPHKKPGRPIRDGFTGAAEHLHCPSFISND